MFDPVAFERDYPADLPPTGFEQLPDTEVEATHASADRHGYDLATTPLDNLFANSALGFDTAGAMHNG